jgi:hypothetical protein
MIERSPIFETLPRLPGRPVEDHRFMGEPWAVEIRHKMRACGITVEALAQESRLSKSIVSLARNGRTGERPSLFSNFTN